jgi:hypothetical protein
LQERKRGKNEGGYAANEEKVLDIQESFQEG